jgi:hypothetical protein
MRWSAENPESVKMEVDEPLENIIKDQDEWGKKLQNTKEVEEDVTMSETRPKSILKKKNLKNYLA